MEIGAGSAGAAVNFHAEEVHQGLPLLWTAAINAISVMMTVTRRVREIHFVLRPVISNWSKNWMNSPTTRAIGQVLPGLERSVTVKPTGIWPESIFANERANPKDHSVVVALFSRDSLNVGCVSLDDES